MKLIVNAHKIDLIKEESVNEKEINISKCVFEFSEEYGDNLVKEAYFTLEGNTYKQIIVNNECNYPPEVLIREGTVELGVVAYEVQNEEYIERFNPSPVYFQTIIGSLKDDAENSQEITPSELEQFEQALEEGLAQAQNVDIDATKEGNTATITITNRLGEEKSVLINDGEKGEDGQPGLTPNIQVGTTTTLPAGSNATVSQRGTTENPIFDFGIPKGQDGTGGGTSDYTDLENKPSINSVTLSGNKTSDDLGLQDALVSGTNIKTINSTSILGSGNIDLTAKWYISNDFLIYNVTPGNYNIVPNNTTTITNTGLPTNEISEALTIANANSKKLILSVYSYKARNFVIYYTSNIPENSASKTLTMGTRTINNDGNLWDSTLIINYGLNFVINSVSCNGIYQYGIGTTNTNAYTPTGDYHPATKKYVDDLVGDIETILTTLTTGNGV